MKTSSYISKGDCLEILSIVQENGKQFSKGNDGGENHGRSKEDAPPKGIY